jgi:hypothetical protein
MKMMNCFGRLKSVGLLTLLLWLLSFQTYHVITEHSELVFGKHYSCSHHDHDEAPSTVPESSEEDCQICKIVSLPFVTTQTFSVDFTQQELQSEATVLYVESSNQQVFYSRGQRGPPVF